MWKKTFKHLKDAGFEVYSPGQHKGLCLSSYIVLRDGSTNAFAGQNRVGYSMLEVHLYHPIDRYSTLQDYRRQVKDSLKKLSDLRYIGQESPALIDDDKQAHAIFIEYQVLKRL